METKVAVVIPNWNGADHIAECLSSLEAQSLKPHIIVVDNGSRDNSVKLIKDKFPNVELLEFKDNAGFAGGVNRGIRTALNNGFTYIALFNNDAVAHKDWLKHLVAAAEENPKTGIITGKFLSRDGQHVDSTGDQYTTWGLPFPRDREVAAKEAHNKAQEVFSATGGASLYRAEMLKKIGLFDEDFFAYYEDVDISFRAQLADWKVLYEPKAEAYHSTGTTSGKIKGFTTYQTFKNQPLLLIKNVPGRLFMGIFARFCIAYASIFISSLIGGRGWPAIKGWFRMVTLLPKKLVERRRIQSSRKVTPQYIDSILVHDLPPNAHKLRRLRALFIGKH